MQHMLDRLHAAQSISKVVVATSTNSVDDPVAALAESAGVGVFRGDEHDVLGRYHAAANDWSANVIVRLTADCPMMDPALVDAAVSLFLEGDVDYVSNVAPRTYPVGFDVEVVSLAALDKTHREALHPELREHVTPYIRGTRPHLAKGAFRIGCLLGPADFSHLRLTVDTVDDLDLVRRLVARLPDGYSWLDAVALLTRTPSEIRHITQSVPLNGLSIREATPGDAAILFRWLNEREKAATSRLTHGAVTWSSHVKWYERRLADPSTLILMAEFNGFSAGQIRLEMRDAAAVIDVHVDHLFRGRGIGDALVRAAIKHAGDRFRGTPLVAEVHPSNSSSVALFEKCGFAEGPAHDGFRQYIYRTQEV